MGTMVLPSQTYWNYGKRRASMLVPKLNAKCSWLHDAMWCFMIWIWNNYSKSAEKTGANKKSANHTPKDTHRSVSSRSSSKVHMLEQRPSSKVGAFLDLPWLSQNVEKFHWKKYRNATLGASPLALCFSATLRCHMVSWCCSYGKN